MSLPLAVFRCDGSPSIGAGHITRCMALGEECLTSGWGVVFAVSNETVSMMAHLTSTSFDIVVLDSSELRDPAALFRIAPSADVLVIDHYQLDSMYERICRKWANKIVTFDDNIGRSHDCDFLIDAAATNPGIYANSLPAHAQVLVGPRFALMRREIVRQREVSVARRDGRDVRTILVSFGSTDPENATAAALDALAKIPRYIGVTVVLSSSALHIKDIQARMGGNMSLVLDPPDIGVLMREADLAIGAGGATAFERALLGLPSIVVAIADNQRGICRLLIESGAAIDGGELDDGLPARLLAFVENLITDAAARQNISEAACNMVDGRAALRLLLNLAGEATLPDGRRIRLRLAELKDSDWLLDLQKQPQTRRFARNPDIPNLENHRRFMHRALTDRDVLLAIIDLEGSNAGMLRLDRIMSPVDLAVFEVSLAVSMNCLGQGVGVAALSLAHSLKPGATFEATILSGNVVSQRLFRGAGYIAVGEIRYRYSSFSRS